MSRHRHYAGPLDLFEMGSGPLVVLLHGAASTAGQWKDLIRQLGQDYHVVAPNLYGYGESPAWSGPNAMTVEDEIAPVLDLIDHHEGPVHLVGHSHGASLSCLIATMIMDRLASLSWYEVNSFYLLEENREPAAWKNGRDVFTNFHKYNDIGDMAGVCRTLIDFWMGDGTWDDMDAGKQDFVQANIHAAFNQFDAIFAARIPFADLAPAGSRLFQMADPHTAPAAWRTAELLAEMLPEMRFEKFPGLTHLGPVQSPEIINPLIIDHIKNWS